MTKQADPVSGVQEFIAGDRAFMFVTIAFDSSYPTGGEPIDATVLDSIGFSQVDYIAPQTTNLAGTRLVTYDRVNKKLLLFTAVGTEAGSASNQSTINDVTAMVVGKRK